MKDENLVLQLLEV